MTFKGYDFFCFFTFYDWIVTDLSIIYG